MNENQDPIEITRYTDYPSYVRDLVDYKRQTANFSLRMFCRKSGFKSPTYLKWVMDEQRPISLKSVHRYIDGLGLSKKEGEYFQLMVNYKEAKDPETKRFYFEQMLFRQQRRDTAPMVKDRYEYLSRWYYVTIREFIAHPEFKEDPHWIQERLQGAVSVWDIKHALQVLARLGLIKRDTQGRWQQCDKELHTGPEVESIAAYSYHSEVLKLSREILTQTPHTIREFSSVVSLLDKKDFVELKKIIYQFQEKVLRYLQGKGVQGRTNGSLQELYMLNVQLLPFTRFRPEKFLDKDNDS